MYNQFNDDKLIGRIKEVFENFEDDSADQGWAELRKRFPGDEKRRPLAAWWWSSAAAILLFTVIGLALYNTSEPVYVTKSGSQVEKKAPATSILKKESAEEKNEDALHAKNNLSSKSALVAASRPADRRAVPENQIVQELPEIPESRGVAFENKSDQEELKIIALENETPVMAAETDVRSETHSLVTATNSEKIEKPVVTEMLQSQASPVSLAEAPQNPKVQEKKGKNLSFAVFAGSYVNYANGGQSGMNTGVGISSDIRISKKLKLSTGISIAQNTLKYEGEVPLTAAVDFRSNISMAEAQLDLGTEKILAPALPASYSLNNYHASLLGLDIPINLKYTLFQNKNELYLIAGVSSNFFLEETYSYSYEMSRGSNNSFETKEDEFANAKAENFDFARMVNFSVGFGHPVGKQSRLSFEPFVKYPIGGQGARDLRFGAAGMNVKLNFGHLKL